ncbi:MAG: cytochrome d ubiquinol oxidase subunit II [bacterium]|nr:cytochrome d ubiquinol oxidase subunit II [bacterium]
MFDFSSYIDLALIWAVLMATVILIYVLLDGFDLGVGVLFPYSPSDKCRDRMMNSIAPFWDGNETWLVMGGGGLFVAFPLAYAILLPAFYIPIILMLLGLILRGVSFEFRFKASDKSRKFWDISFHIGSLVATFFQGTILGAFIQGVKVNGRNFSGGPFDWATVFSMMTGVALIFGYSLLGSTWLIMKTEDITQQWARKAAKYSLGCVALFTVLVSCIIPQINPEIKQFWFNTSAIYLLVLFLAVTILLFCLLWSDLKNEQIENRPFFLAMGIFLMSFIGLGISFFPWIIPFQYTIWQAAASGPGLSLVLVGVVPLLPLILGYTAYSYYIFRGKTSHEHLY